MLARPEQMFTATNNTGNKMLRKLDVDIEHNSWPNYVCNTFTVNLLPSGDKP